jgi:hypothetical protein
LIIGHDIASSTGCATGTGPGSSKSVFLIFGEFVMDVQVPVRLTALASCGGCASKLGSAELASVLHGLPSTSNDRVLVGFGTADDAGVFALRDDLALVQTVDFFTPIVDDPYDFGRVAATNAISDVYAMGGTPITALNIVAFPENLDLAVLSRILEGGADVARAAGVAILGGHTIKDDEPKYGMAVSGTIDPRHRHPYDRGQARRDFLRRAASGHRVDDDAQRRRRGGDARSASTRRNRYHRLRRPRPRR